MRLLPRLSQEKVDELATFTAKTNDIKAFKRGKAIQMLNAQKDIETIIEYTGYSRSQIFSLRSAYVKDGIKAIQTKRKGEPKRLLTKRQLKKIVETVKTKKPKDVGFDESFDYWSTGVLGK